METTLQRIKKYIDSKGISTRAFEMKIGFSNGAFASQLKNNKTIGVDKLENILNSFPDLNPVWVLTGQGEMLADHDGSLQLPENEKQLFKDLVESQKGEIKSLRLNVKLLQESLNDKLLTIGELRKGKGE